MTDGHYVDCTFGRGGHSKLILEKISSKGYLSSFDKDPEAYEFGLNFKNNNFKIYHDSFKNLDKYFKDNSINGIIYDLGTCSTHLDNANRGLVLIKKANLICVLITLSESLFRNGLEKAKKKEIIEILYKYGDEKHARLIAECNY